MAGSLDPAPGPGDHVAGPPGAPLALVMYGDFECPYCAAAQSVLARVRARLGDRLRLVFRHFPLQERHPHAWRAAEMSEAAAARGAFWPMHDALYAGRGFLADDDLVRHAAGIGLDGEEMLAEARSGLYAERVERDRASGLRSGVAATPGFFVNGRQHIGAYDAGSLVEALEAPAP